MKFIGIVFLLPVTSLASFSVTIPSGEEECFTIQVPPNSMVSGDFDLVDEDVSAGPISARFENGEKVLWKSHSNDAEAYFDLDIIEGGSHKFCLENGLKLKSDGEEREVGWAIHVRQKGRSLEADEEGPDAERALQLVESAEELQDHWEALIDHYGFLRTREFQHYQLSNQIMGRLVKWTAFEGIILVVIACLQILYLRKFMETRRYL